MKEVSKYIPLVGRIFLALIFLLSAFNKITGFNGTLGFMQSAGIPFTALALVIAIALELGGSVSLILGLKAKWGAWALIIFTIPVTLIFHNILIDSSQINQFMKNLAIIGGLLLVTAYGSGPFSLDKNK